MQRAVFRALGAVITRVDGKNQCQIAAMLSAGQLLDLADAGRWIPVDLDKTPSKAAAWGDVHFDDRGIGSNGKPLPAVVRPIDLPRMGITSIGPIAALPNGQFFGAVYMLESDFLDAAMQAKIKDPTGAFDWCPSDWFTHELVSVCYSADVSNGKKVGKRYVGIHGKVVKRGPGSTVAVAVTSASTSPRGVVGTWRVDLKDPDECDDLGPVYGADQLISDTVDEGALYVELGFAAAAVMRGPKIPLGMVGW